MEIASYCDPELLDTVKSALIQADIPERISFSICYQSDDEKDYKELKKIDNCKVVWLKVKEAKGLCYARYLCQKMITDEKYVYQIDSHMRFVKHWDTKLIEDLLSLKDDKAIISFYPANYSEGMIDLPLDDKIFDKPTGGGLMHVKGFRYIDSPFVAFYCDSLSIGDPKAHKRSAFISGGNFFSFSEVHKEVFPDPDMYFYGDELFMDINLFTHGWNVYNSDVCYIYHHYCRPNSKFSKVENGMENEKNRFMELLDNRNNKLLLEKYGIGTTRTIDDFEKFAGIDFKNRIIYLNAESGELENKDYIGKISYFSKKQTDMINFINKEETITVLIVDLYREYKDCIKYCLKNASSTNNINFVIGSISSNQPTKEECTDLHIKKFITFDQDSTYCKILNKISKDIDEGYVAIIDSSIKLLDDWDKYLCENVKKCGEKAALTSWVWESNENKDNYQPYINIEKNITNYYYYLPTLEFNKSIDFSKMNHPYQTAVPFDGFLFLHSSILKQIEIDPNLSYEEHKYIYAIRLWTNGINLYIPCLSHVIRSKQESLLNSDNNHISTVCALSGIDCYYSKLFESDYHYDIGNKRPIWTWYKFININYDDEKKEIIN